ncbi:MAG TPA: RNA-binding S4 domain-containing protein [Acidimicrobiales bacterium]|nr:RNA-binding S4 domain-containing protein [Acidimicrobiales bacterium]
MESVRVDQWLWAVRLCKTRTAATEAAKGAHVRVNGHTARPATAVRAGDRVEVRLHDRDRVMEVLRAIDKRVGAPVAAECYIDHSPPAPQEEHVPRLFPRAVGAGRPTKRERRETDRLRGRSVP